MTPTELIQQAAQEDRSMSEAELRTERKERTVRFLDQVLGMSEESVRDEYENPTVRPAPRPTAHTHCTVTGDPVP